MEFMTKKQYRGAIASMINFPILFIIGIVLVCLRGINGLEETYIISISVDLFGMLMGYVLYICCLFDVEKSDAHINNYFYLLNVAFLTLFVDAGSWLVDGVPSLRIANIIDNFILFVCSPIQAFLFWKYVSSFLRIEDKVYRITDSVLKIGLFISLISRVVNIFTGHYYTISSEGVYTRSPLFPLSISYVIIVLIVVAVFVVKEHKHFKKYQLVVLVAYVMAPLLASVFTIFVYGLSVAPAVVMLTMLLMYCALNISQGREKAVADRDLSVASAIQENVLPRIFPYLPERKEFDLYASMTAAKEVGGDFYDFFLIDEDHIALVMADVSGKGIPAALFMMIARTMIKNYAMTGQYSPAKILEHVNEQIMEGNDVGLFVTVWLAIISLKDGKGVAANAGHEHPALRRNGGNFELVKYRHSVAIGTMDGVRFREHEFELHPGDTLFVYTDGVAEATNSNSVLFGDERLLEALNKNPDASPRELLWNVMGEINGFVNGAKQFDDITMLSLKYFGSEGKEQNETEEKTEEKTEENTEEKAEEKIEE